MCPRTPGNNSTPASTTNVSSIATTCALDFYEPVGRSKEKQRKSSTGRIHLGSPASTVASSPRPSCSPLSRSTHSGLSTSPSLCRCIPCISPCVPTSKAPDIDNQFYNVTHDSWASSRYPLSRRKWWESSLSFSSCLSATRRGPQAQAVDTGVIRLLRPLLRRESRRRLLK